MDYQTIDFVSAALGYTVGVVLCYSIMKTIFEIENADEE